VRLKKPRAAAIAGILF
jgi:hypothetical protein